MSTYKKFSFVGDRENATYRHIIHLKPEFATNQKVSSEGLQGYSKHKGHAEMFDKTKCFAEYVSRLLTRYLYKSTVIEFYTNNRQGLENDELLCYATNGNYFISPKFNNVRPLIDLLEKAKRGEIVYEEKAPKLIKTKTDIAKFFVYQKGFFRDLTHLNEYCAELKNTGIPAGRVDGYYYDVMQKQDLK